MKILFVYHKAMASFIRKDLEILRKRHQVKVVRYSKIWDAYTILRGVNWCNLTYCWFGSIHAFFPILFSKVLAKKSIVVAGGYDVACVPEISYGLFCYWWKKWLPLFVFRYTDIILTVSKSNTTETLENAKVDSGKVKLIYHGFDFNRYKANPNVEKQPMVLTVGAVSRLSLLRKGLEVFVKSASLLPNFKFILVGKWADDSVHRLKSLAPQNVCFLNNLENKALLDVFRRSKVYVQASYHEAFGCSLAEAMLCECIPVVTKVAALPEVVGDCGFFSTDQNPEELAALINKALNNDLGLGKRARERIKKLFPLEKREKALLQVVEQLMTESEENPSR